MRSIEETERAMDARMEKFQPRPSPGFRITGLARTYLEYDDSGTYWEFNPATGDVVETGVLERQERTEAA